MLSWWPWLCAVAAALATVVLVAGLLVERQLRDNGAEEAANWVRLVQSGGSDLDAGLQGRGFGPQTLEQLRRLSTSEEVFRFKLFDLQGRLVLDSQTLQPDTAPTPEARTEAQDALRAATEGGPGHVTIHHTGEGRIHHFSAAVVPFIVNGQRIGVFKIYVDQSARAESLEDAFITLCLLVALLTCVLAGTAAWRAWRQLRDKLQTEERVRYLASHDALSGTLNRSSFTDALDAAAWRCHGGGPGFAVLCIDLDRFKEVNDAHGHAAGDEVLRAVGERLRSVLRHGDAVARLGGDEFAVMQSGVQAAQDTSRLAARIVGVLAEPFEVGGLLLRCGGSVGAAVFGPGIADSAHLLQQADAAMYQAKTEGRGCFRFYNAQIESEVQDRRELARDLRTALASGELRLDFQALYDHSGGRLRGYEALMRWTHPVRGPVPPGVFIPLAEEGHLIETLGAWALQTACSQAVSWPGELAVAVNLSAAQFERGDLVATVQQALADSGLSAQRLELEITESLLINNTQQVLLTLGRLGALGVRIAMDDFGTGYSSLAYLWRFPFDKLKIDRAFTQGLGSDPRVDVIVRSIVGLAHSLAIRVTAEGVETEAQRDALRQLGCDELQGYLLGRPAPAERLPHLEQEIVAVVVTEAPTTAALQALSA